MSTAPYQHNAPATIARPANTATAPALQFLAFTLAQEKYGNEFRLDDGQVTRMIANPQPSNRAAWPTRVVPALLETDQDKWGSSPLPWNRASPANTLIPFGQGFRRPFDQVLSQHKTRWIALFVKARAACWIRTVSALPARLHPF